MCPTTGCVSPFFSLSLDCDYILPPFALFLSFHLTNFLLKYSSPALLLSLPVLVLASRRDGRELSLVLFSGFQERDERGSESQASVHS